MYRHSPIRNHKSKGFRLKHVLQICVLVAVCFWLIYQVKHSYDKRNFFDENDAKTSRDVEMNNAVLKFGRKDLNPQEKGPDKDLESHDEEIMKEDKNEEEIVEEDKNEEEIVEEDKNEEEIGEETEEEDKHEEETGEEETGEDKHEEETGEQDKHEEENEEEDKHEEETGVEDKHEKEEQVEDIETEEKGVEGREDGDDSVNEQEQEKTDSDVNQGEVFIDEEKDKEDTDEKQIEDKDDDIKDSQEKNDSSIEDHDHDEGSRNTREAREEQYKGDDASSAVTHDGHITSTENVSGSMENQASTVEHKSKNNITEDGNTGQYTTEVIVRDLEAAGNGNSTSDEEKSSKVLDSFSQGNSSLTSITALESNGQSDTINNTDTQDLSIKNGTEIIMSDLSQSQSVTDGNITAAEGANFETLVMEQSDNSTVALGNTNLNSNSSSSTEIKNVEENPVESTDFSMNSEIVSLETLAQSNVSAENKDGSESTTIVETTNEVGNENPENIKGTEGTYENSNSSNTEDTDEVQHNSVDSSELSVPVDDRENHIDLGTLPDIRTEGSNSEGVSEE